MLHKLRLTGRDGLFQKVGIFANVPVEHRLIAEHLNKDGFGLLDTSFCKLLLLNLAFHQISSSSISSNILLDSGRYFRRTARDSGFAVLALKNSAKPSCASLASW